jgi:hypothetical protein
MAKYTEVMQKLRICGLRMKPHNAEMSFIIAENRTDQLIWKQTKVGHIFLLLIKRIGAPK